MSRGEVWWATLPDPVGSGPGYRRPVAVVQADEFSRSRISTVVVAVMTGNMRLAAAPGNVLCTRRDTGLRRSSVINVSHLLTLDKSLLRARVRALSPEKAAALDAGLRLVLAM